MEPVFLVPEQTVHANGEAAAVEISGVQSVLITFGITAAVEQQFLQLSVQGSIDGTEWAASPLLAFPQKFYPGVSSVLLDLQAHPAVRYLRAQWKTKRWGRGDQTPGFTFYVFAEPVA